MKNANGNVCARFNLVVSQNDDDDDDDEGGGGGGNDDEMVMVMKRKKSNERKGMKMSHRMETKGSSFEGSLDVNMPKK